MTTEPEAWKSLHGHAAGRIRAGFADRVLRAARAGARRAAAPSLTQQFLVCAAFAGLCFLAVVAFNARSSVDENSQNLAGWRDIAAQVDALDQSQTL